MRRVAFVVVLTTLSAPAFAQDKPDAKKPADPPKPAAKPEEKKTDDKKTEEKSVTAATAKSPLDFTMKDIDGKDVPLSKYKGKTVMIVNVASKCGMTPQYEQLEQLHQKYGSRGLTILAFPANNFGGQEPGTNDEIKSFCKTKYSIGFDLFSKVSVKGDDCCELYKFLTSKEKNEKLGGDIGWNFTKFLVDRDGDLIERFDTKTKPDAPEVVKAIETQLDKKADK